MEKQDHAVYTPWPDPVQLCTLGKYFRERLHSLVRRAHASYVCAVVGPRADLSSPAVHTRAPRMYRAAAVRAARSHERPFFSRNIPSTTARAVKAKQNANLAYQCQEEISRSRCSRRYMKNGVICIFCHNVSRGMASPRWWSSAEVVVDMAVGSRDWAKRPSGLGSEAISSTNGMMGMSG